MSGEVERVQAAWNAVSSLPPIEFSELEAASLLFALATRTPSDADRTAVVEECARVADQERKAAVASVAPGDGHAARAYSAGWDSASSRIATAIRRLSTVGKEVTDGGEWQSIESAPEDGSDAIVGVWVEVDGEPPYWSSWTVVLDGSTMGCDGAFGDPPTHWMPAPTPPIRRLSTPAGEDRP